MSYTKNTWATGDTITATKLNNMEDGIANAGSVLICNTSYSSSAGVYVLDKTAQEIYEALLSGTPAYIKNQYGSISDYTMTLYLAPIIKIYTYDNNNVIRIVASKPGYLSNKDGYVSLYVPGTLNFSATSLNDYPKFIVSLATNSSSLSTEGID